MPAVFPCGLTWQTEKKQPERRLLKMNIAKSCPPTEFKLKTSLNYLPVHCFVVEEMAVKRQILHDFAIIFKN